MAHLPKGQGVIPLPPFQAWLSSNIPAVYDNTMTYYEELCALLKYLQDQVVPALNDNASAITTLSDYVEHYFDNLDVQEEINNKLDEMAEDGTLQEIIADYINANVAWTFDTVGDMKAAENLIAGSYAQTLGYTTVNDGGGAIYLITSTLSDDCETLDSGLYAKLIPASLYSANMFDLYGITVETGRHSNGTKYYITHIPYTNKLGFRNELVQGFPHDDFGNATGETVRDFANRHNSPFAMNIGLMDLDNDILFGPVVQNGVELTPTHANAFSPIGIDGDGMLTVFQNGTTASTMIGQGIVYACCGYDELIHNNEVVYDTSAPAWTTTLYQHQILAQLTNGDYIVLTCDGKGYEDQEVGLTYEMLANILMTKFNNIRTAYACDGGGSVSTVVNHEFINQASDDNFTTERNVYNVWYIKPVNTVENFLSLYKKIGNIEAQVKEMKAEVGYLNTIYGTHGVVVKKDAVTERINAIDGKFRVTNVTANKDVLYIDLPSGHPNEFQIDSERVYSLFKIMKTPSDYSITAASDINFPSMIFADANTLSDIPDPSVAHVVITFPVLATNNCFQIAMPYHTNTSYVTKYRYSVSGTWRAWRTL